MLRIFRKMRWRYASDNQPASPADRFFKYLRYAIGEILLIVIGIIVALQLQNWNETRKQNQRFKIVLEQIYNAINDDVETFQSRTRMMNNQARYLDSLLVDPEYIEKERLPHFLYWIANINLVDFNSETSHHLSKLEYNPESKEQSELARLITLYVDKNSTHRESLSNELAITDNSLWRILKENAIPYPGHMTEVVINEFMHVETDYYTDEELNRVYALLFDPVFRSELKSFFNARHSAGLDENFMYEEAVSIRDLIKNYYPEIKVIYRDVGVIGTALDGYQNTKSRTMIQTDIENNIWETELELKAGTVKFRCRNSWSQNWGGDSFPEGTAQWFGRDIEVEPGHYHITLDLNNYTYSFTKILD